MSENITVARPYAEAVFSRAVETQSLDAWSGMLGFLSAAFNDSNMASLLSDPRVEREQLAQLVLDVAGDKLSGEGQNLVRLMAENRRLDVVPAMSELFEQLKREQEGSIDVEIVSAFPVSPDQESSLGAALKKRLGRDVIITSRQDETLLGGVKIHAGDLVIDGSVKGQLAQLANALD